MNVYVQEANKPKTRERVLFADASNKEEAQKLANVPANLLLSVVEGRNRFIVVYLKEDQK